MRTRWPSRRSFGSSALSQRRASRVPDRLDGGPEGGGRGLQLERGEQPRRMLELDEGRSEAHHAVVVAEDVEVAQLLPRGEEAREWNLGGDEALGDAPVQRNLEERLARGSGEADEHARAEERRGHLPLLEVVLGLAAPVGGHALDQLRRVGERPAERGVTGSRGAVLEGGQHRAEGRPRGLGEAAESAAQGVGRLAHHRGVRAVVLVGEGDVQPDGRRTGLVEPRHRAGEQLAAPGPAAVALHRALVDGRHDHVRVWRTDAPAPHLEIRGAALERREHAEHAGDRTRAGARLPTVGGPVEHAQGQGDGEPHQLVAATAHPPEALGQQAPPSLRPGGGRGASGRRSSEVGQIA